jgi:hypothetical protein
MLMYFMAIWNILRTFWIFMTICCILCSFGTFGFGIMCQEKSGNPGTGEGDEHSGNRSRNVEEESE